MELVTKYRCEHCGELLDTEIACIEHEQHHLAINKANEMLKSGCTLDEVNKETNIWKYGVPEHLLNTTKDNCFIVSHWQCCEKPAYKIDRIDFYGNVRLWGCGSWSGYYGEYVPLSFRYLKDARPIGELFVDKRHRYS